MEATLAVPVFRVSRAVCTDDFDALYRKLKPDGVTVSALLAKAAGVALAKTPLMNAAYDAAGSNVVYNARINVAQAVALEGGLITPTLVDADARSLADLSAAWKDLVVRARAGTLKPDEYTSGTFTISNLGMMDVEQFDAILPPGTGAILAVASARPVAIPMAGAALGVGLRKEMVVTVTCDHRIISGADAATFLADFAAAVETPADLAK
jgi:pyruvate dehydrogenase E2 component (dihydrolipoamide acetyltransferase)